MAISDGSKAVEAALSLWAKSAPYHSLLSHMLDTAALALAVLEREPRRTQALYAEDWGLEPEEAGRFVSFLVGLHDLGKASPVFQAAWPEGAQRVWNLGLTWDKELVKERPVAHGVFTELYVTEALKAFGFSPRAANKLAKGLGAHHGFLVHPGERELGLHHVKNEPPSWQEARNHLVKRLVDCLGLTALIGRPLRDVSEPAVLRVMALASFADWIASDPNFFPYGRDAQSPEYWERALALARQALDEILWPQWRSAGKKDFSDLFPFPPNPLQAAVSRLLSEVREEPVLLLVEAPMGMGKTEAALYAFYVLKERLEQRGLYMALPTQATANGLFPRVKSFLEKLAQGERWDLQLQHGVALLNPEYEELLALVRPAEVHDRNDGGAVAASAWFSARKRAMLSAHGVGTLDQALLGVLRVKHHFVRLWGLMNRVVVLDEVHAYDTYTSGLLLALLRWLKALGSSVVLMTATLPKHKREELLSAWGVSGVELPAYPRVAVFGAKALLGAEALPQALTKRVRLKAAPVEASALAEGLKRHLPGALGAIVNTVDRAQALYQALGKGERLTLSALQDLLGTGPKEGPWPELWAMRKEKGHFVVGKRLPDGTLVFLLHARFPAEERALRESLALALFGKYGPRPERTILVATQVAEQSLDLDFDLLYSDLAPIDLLFQRVGRLHRHDRPRPEPHREPVLLVGGLAEEPEFDQDLHWDKVYEEFLLLSTWVSLHGREEICIPHDLEGLLEEVYGRQPAEFPTVWRSKAEESYKRLLERLKQEAATAENLSLSGPGKLLSQTDAAALLSDFRLDDEEEDPRTQRFLTRLGEPSIPVVPLYRIGEGWYLDPEGRRQAKLVGELSKEEAVAIWSRAVRLSRFPVPQKLLAEAPPSAWANSGLLQGLRALEVGRNFDGLVVDLDPELGVVYRRV